MFYCSSTNSLKSLNEVNARPKRTSYGEMSTWFFMDSKSDHNQNSYLNFNDIDTASYKNIDDLTFPSINNQYFANNNKIKRLPSAREVVKSPVVRDFLMKNWSEKRFESNKYSPAVITDERKGRSGAGGVWSNITQAFREDGNRLLFIQEPTYNRVPYVPKIKTEDNIKQEKRKTIFGRELTTAYLDKLQRERLGVQTKHGVEHGNWNLTR